jgi:hypothetical protein
MLKLPPKMFYLKFPDVRGFAWLNLIQVCLLLNWLSRKRGKSALAWNSRWISVVIGSNRAFGLWSMTFYVPHSDRNVMTSPNLFKISINCYQFQNTAVQNLAKGSQYLLLPSELRLNIILRNSIRFSIFRVCSQGTLTKNLLWMNSSVHCNY